MLNQGSSLSKEGGHNLYFFDRGIKQANILWGPQLEQGEWGPSTEKKKEIYRSNCSSPSSLLQNDKKKVEKESQSAHAPLQNLSLQALCFCHIVAAAPAFQLME